jgi:cell division protein FtsZ
VLRQAIQGISDLILVPGLINLDFADVKTIMAGMGLAMMGRGVAEGADRAIEAARRAISSPLLEGASVNGARGVIINVTGGPDLSLVEVSEASCIVQEAADEDANIIFGAVVDPMLKGKVKITVIATGFTVPAATRPAPSTAVTPVDMTNYAEHPRLRAEPPAAVSAPSAPRLSIARRPLLDLGSMAAAGGKSLTASAAGSGGNGAARTTFVAESPSAADADMMIGAMSASADTLTDDFDLGSTFDVPAFLRRQEG